MKLSIIIVSWNVSSLLKDCLDSIVKYKPDFAYEIIVIDNASSDDSIEMLANEYPDITCIANKENLGFAKANNQGIQIAKGEYILLLNPDTQVMSRTLEKSIQFMQTHTDCGVMGCKMLNSDYSLQESVRSFPSFFSQAGILLKIHHLFPRYSVFSSYLMRDFDYTHSQKVDQVKGAYFLVPKKVFETIGLLDENFFIWFEEVDFCKRVKEAGLQVYYYCAAKILHHESKSFAQVMSVKKQKMWNRSLRVYARKHYTILERIGISVLCPIAVFLSWMFSKRIKK